MSFKQQIQNQEAKGIHITYTRDNCEIELMLLTASQIYPYPLSLATPFYLKEMTLSHNSSKKVLKISTGKAVRTIGS